MAPKLIILILIIIIINNKEEGEGFVPPNKAYDELVGLPTRDHTSQITVGQGPGDPSQVVCRWMDLQFEGRALPPSQGLDCTVLYSHGRCCRRGPGTKAVTSKIICWEPRPCEGAAYYLHQAGPL